jgi:hypothetical protein
MLVDLPLSSFCRTEKSVVPSAAGTTISPSRTVELALMRQAPWTTFLKRPIVAAASEDLRRLVGDVDLDPVAVELDFVNQPGARWHLLDGCRQSRLNEAWERRLGTDRLGFSTLTPL